VVISLLAVLSVLLAYYAGRSLWLLRRTRDRFVSPRAHEVFRGTQAVFDQTGGNATYSEYKARMAPGVDAVVYSDLRSLWKSGGLTPEAVQEVI